MSDALLALHGVSYQYPDATWRLDGVSLACHEHEVLAIIGPNGSGKSTVLKLGAGILRPAAGRVELAGQAITALSRRQVARSLGYLPQNVASEFDYRVEEVVAMGRFAHVRGAGFLAAADLAVIGRSLEATEMTGFRHRRLSRLSGGERQRAMLASVLAQEPAVLLLDEPTSALDLHHQVRFFALLRRLAADGMAVAVVTHDVNLASLYSDRVALFRGGQLVEDGTPDAVLRPDVLADTYGDEVLLEKHPVTGRPIVLPNVQETRDG